MIRQVVATENMGIVEKLEMLIDLLTRFFPQILAMMDRDVVLDDGTLVGKMTPKIDDELGKILNLKGRGN